ncbi:copper homeostasis protein CutC [Streptococcus azizii]|uniref:PF03932 family protein CutC n=1 Tax=Streptococcus azizii TaxID=1579424 RepID=A0AB36JPC0_9STRE|nr:MULTISPECIES: copper homeostasis protein CutC [Streptococcus]MBF0776028.1 copper homeostasis protein CutC [Streptococcus sp. 19428wD3_AN2]ONK26359.1 copper homeostasis protein CutC [Streptococcus azizii]ONK28156.1 copper homeostasis protein CutC [Streptococcus azizii]ONK29106.1 copper homeostasis protein CutC [Streptococcus azizii]TFU83822.1 copper homeostasis protein CutC [Streptococcus sp. AN2]
MKEFCAENHVRIAQAIALGAGRIELCDNLAAGGTTPSYGVIQAVCKIAHEQGVAVMTMVRPRGGDFCYDVAEKQMMLEDARIAKELGSDGLVFGALTEDNWIDEEFVIQLLKEAGDRESVFHMAFDMIPRKRQFEAMDWLVEQGVIRILTRGGIDGSASDNVTWLKELIAYANGRIEILIGGGITKENAGYLMKELGVTQVHGTRLFW